MRLNGAFSAIEREIASRNFSKASFEEISIMTIERIPFQRYLLGYGREALTALRSVTNGLRQHPQKFVIFGRGRSGSTLLVDLLNQNEVVDCDKEIFNRPVLFPRLFLHHRNRIFPKEVYGFTLLSYQLRERYSWAESKNFLHYLVHEKGYKVLYLCCDNPVNQCMSKHYARFKGSWHQKANSDQSSLHVNIPNFMAELRAGKELDVFEKYCLEGIPNFKISYEKDLLERKSRMRLMDRLSNFLEISFMEPKASRFKRISNGKVEDYVENWQDLKTCLSYSEFAPYL